MRLFAWRNRASPNLHANELSIGIVADAKQNELEPAIICELKPIEPVARMCLFLGEDANKARNQYAQLFERRATGELFNGGRRLREGKGACAEAVPLKRRSLDDGWELGMRAIRLAITGAVWSERRKMQITLRRDIFVGGAAMVNKGNCALVTGREDEKWLVLKQCAQSSPPRRILFQRASNCSAAEQENDNRSFHRMRVVTANDEAQRLRGAV